MHFSVRARPQNALFRRVRFSSPAQTRRHLTQRRILCRRPHVKAQSGGVTLTQKRILHRRCHRDVTERRILDGRRHGKAHFACGPHQKAHSACGRWLRREAIFADLCTLLHTHNRSRGRAGATGPTTSTAPWPRDAQVPGPEVHATGAVTQPSTYTSSRSLTKVQI